MDATVGMGLRHVAAGNVPGGMQTPPAGQPWDENATVRMGIPGVAASVPLKTAAAPADKKPAVPVQAHRQNAPTPPPAPAKKKTKLLIGIVAALLVAAIGIGAVLMGSMGDSSKNSDDDEVDVCSENGHDWQAADCTTPKTCSECGKARGAALGHSWTEGDCTTPKTCRNCGESQGAASGHSWTNATCTAPKTCSNCGETTGQAAGHNWTAATTTSPKTCQSCGATEGDPVLDIVVGDVITMGYYGNEKIEWIVLEYDPSTKQALVISKYCLEAIPFHAGTGSGTWENSTLRKWLNNNFISMAFNEEERAAILTTHLTTNDNADYGTDSGNDTTDRVFLLSYEEAVYYFPSSTSRQGTPTDYCKAQGCYDPVKYAEEHGETVESAAIGHTWWWLRTAGRNENTTCNVVAKGAASTYGADQTSNEGTIRPAMWIQLG